MYLVCCRILLVVVIARVPPFSCILNILDTKNTSTEPQTEAAGTDRTPDGAVEASISNEIPLATSANVDPGRIGDVLRGTSRPNFKNRGGAGLHKDPNCKCAGCTARRRSEEARSITIGGGGFGNETHPETSLEVSHAADRTQIVAEEYNPNKSKKVAAKVRVAQWLGMRALEPDMSNSEIARRMGISAPTLRAAITKAVQEGWLKFEDPIQAIEYQIIPKVVRNLNQFLDAGDKQVTIETAKGTLFKSFQEATGVIQAPQTVLALKIEFPEGTQPNSTVMAGKIVGVPKISE